MIAESSGQVDESRGKRGGDVAITCFTSNPAAGRPSKQSPPTPATRQGLADLSMTVQINTITQTMKLLAVCCWLLAPRRLLLQHSLSLPGGGKLPLEVGDREALFLRRRESIG